MRELVGPPPVSTPSGVIRSGARARGLPDDLLRAASDRLAVMSLFFAALWLVGVALGHFGNHILEPDKLPWWRPDVGDAIAAIGVTVSLGLYVYVRRGDRNPTFVLELGLWYMVYMAIAIAAMLHLGGSAPISTLRPEVTWVGAIILIIAALVPTTPKKMLIASTIAVSINPLVILVLGARAGWTLGPRWLVLVKYYPDFLLVGAAVVISIAFTRLGQQVTKERELGSYRLGDLLGRGGMGEVYKATHRMLARPAAIKLIRPEMLGGVDAEAAKVAVARFKREAEAAANLRSQHTVELYDFGVTADGTLYLVMEYLEGMDLETLVGKAGPLGTGRVVHILRQVCASLAEAHALGMVHRDIKPANIHVGRVGLSYDFVKVLDFGLVKDLTQVAVGDSMSTVPGQMGLGTPSYMAPEMAVGEQVDGRADIYALGCVAYFLVTGERVFEADTTFALIAKHLQSLPIPPSLRTSKPVSPDLERLIMKCLAKDPIDRPQSAARLAEALTWIPVDPWGEDQARVWWEANAPAVRSDAVSISSAAASSGTQVTA